MCPSPSLSSRTTLWFIPTGMQNSNKALVLNGAYPKQETYLAAVGTQGSCAGYFQPVRTIPPLRIFRKAPEITKTKCARYKLYNNYSAALMSPQRTKQICPRRLSSYESFKFSTIPCAILKRGKTFDRWKELPSWLLGLASSHVVDLLDNEMFWRYMTYFNSRF